MCEVFAHYDFLGMKWSGIYRIMIRPNGQYSSNSAKNPGQWLSTFR